MLLYLFLLFIYISNRLYTFLRAILDYNNSTEAGIGDIVMIVNSDYILGVEKGR